MVEYIQKPMNLPKERVCVVRISVKDWRDRLIGGNVLIKSNDLIRSNETPKRILTFVETFRNFSCKKRVVSTDDHQQNRIDEDEKKSEIDA